MNNPFEKRDHTVLVASVVVGSVAAGAATYLLLTEAGAKLRERFTAQFNSLGTLFAGIGNAGHTQPATTYIHKRKKSPKIRREALLKQHELTVPDNNEVAEE